MLLLWLCDELGKDASARKWSISALKAPTMASFPCSDSSSSATRITSLSKSVSTSPSLILTLLCVTSLEAFKHSNTWPERRKPSTSFSCTITIYFGNFTSSNITNGPFTLDTVLYMLTDLPLLYEKLSETKKYSQKIKFCLINDITC